jgi:N-methylhydantoinase A
VSERSSYRLRVGIDVGGTSTDLYALDELSGRSFTHKVSSSPADPHRAPIQALRDLLDRLGAEGSDVAFLGLGTTVATNAFLESKGASVGLITTRGFRDLIEIGRQTRPHLYDPFVRKPAPLVPRMLRLEATERVAADGSIVTLLDEEEVHWAVSRLRAAGVSSVAICFLNAYANPEHEARARAIVTADWPEAAAVTSSDVVPEFREYERFVSTIINASLVPIVRDYFREFARGVTALGVPTPPVVVSSSGGVFTTEIAAARPIDTLFSGPSGGVSGALEVCEAAGVNDFVTFDMGGTSTEVCLVRGGAPQMTHARSLRGYPLRTTSYDIHTIGAGGSSIASVDEGGMLQVGPQSAGANPGPACYATGGEAPTVTDANVVLGRLNSTHLLGGALPIDAARAAASIERHIAKAKDIAVTDAASAIVALAEANMAQAIRVVSVERGLDPADYVLVAFGGAGPLHACAVARLVGMAGVLVPRHPGVLCAKGVLTKDIEVNLGRTRIVDASRPDALSILATSFSALERDALERLLGQRVDRGHVVFRRAVAARYKGQNHEIDVPFADGEVNGDALQFVVARFHEAHRELYGYAFERNPVEVVTARVAALVPIVRPEAARSEEARTHSTGRPRSERNVFYDGRAMAWPVFDRSDLNEGQVVLGPAIIEQMDTTIVIPPKCMARVDSRLNLHVRWS